MKFCQECNSILQPKENNEDNKLYLICRQCGYKEENKSSVISKKIYKSNASDYIGSKSNMIYDNTLPHTKKKDCPNNDCPSKKNVDIKDVVFYTDSNTLKINFICAICKTEWNT
jgi:DNA-directed RNA polymerase II subunit RPB9